MFTCTEEEYREHEDNFEGICLSCGEWQPGVEDDAEGYICECCGESKVVGAGQALVMGMLDFD